MKKVMARVGGFDSSSSGDFVILSFVWSILFAGRGVKGEKGFGEILISMYSLLEDRSRYPIDGKCKNYPFLKHMKFPPSFVASI